MKTKSCKTCSHQGKRCDCPTDNSEREAQGPSDAAACPPSLDTPETDAFEANQHPSCRFPAVLEQMRKLERERNHWRNEHDRILHEYQHRLTVLATSAIEATHYPENNQIADA